MPNALQMAGALSDPSSFAPLHTNRIFTGLWTNRSPLRDAATSDYEEHFGMGRQDSIIDGFNSEISPRLTLKRRAGTSVYNASSIAPVKRFYSFNTFTLTDELIRVMADTATDVLDVTAPGSTPIWHKSAGAGPTYFLGVGNTLYFTNGVDNKQWLYGTNTVYNWGIPTPTTAPLVSQALRPNPYSSWQPNTAYSPNNPARAGMIIVDDTGPAFGNIAVIPVQGGGNFIILTGQNAPNGSAIPFPTGFAAARAVVWTTPCNGNYANDIAGVYQSSGVGGILSSSFQNRSGGFGASATSNWIALAWDAAAVPNITVATSAGFTTLHFVTSNGDYLGFTVGQGAQGTSIPAPVGATGLSLSICGMSGSSNVNFGLLTVDQCHLSGGIISALYDDNAGNSWPGSASVFAAFWNSGQGTSAITVTNGLSLNVPTTSGGRVTLVFSSNLANGASFGLPAGFTSANTSTTGAIGETVPFSSGNKAHGWAMSFSGQTFTGNYNDTSGHSWSANGFGFAVGWINNATSGNLQWFNGTGTTGATEPSAWGTHKGDLTPDNTVTWTCIGSHQWLAGTAYALGDAVMGAVPGSANQIFICTTPGVSGTSEPAWHAGVNLQVGDGPVVVWTCAGRALSWSDIGASTNITNAATVVDSNGYLENVVSGGKSGATAPWPTTSPEIGQLTTDNTVVWVNTAAFSPAGTAPVQYAYAWGNSATFDIGSASPRSPLITISQNNQVILQGDGSPDPQDDTVYLYRTAQGGSTLLLLDTIPMPPAGQQWTYTDNIPDSGLNTEIQAQVSGEGTPLPAGATCLGYHLGRIAAAVGNVVYISSGPDAVASGSSGNAGFDTTFTAQSKITRFWTCSLGLVVFTVRDAYIILGSATDADPLYMVVFIEDLPLRSYDCFAVNKTTPYLLMGNNQLVSLDPSAGIIEVGFPIADILEEDFDAAAAYVTFHAQSSRDMALYVASGTGYWYRMAQNSAPEQGTNWSTRATIAGTGAVQSVEVLPGQYRLLISGTAPGPILQRDTTVNTDNGVPFPAETTFGNVVLAQPGQLAALSFITLESVRVGTRPALALLLGEISGTFDGLNRTRQDPTNLPPSSTLFSDRYHFQQNQNEAWCRHFQMRLSWPAEDAANELLTFTVFGQTWQEMKSQ